MFGIRKHLGQTVFVALKLGHIQQTVAQHWDSVMNAASRMDLHVRATL